MRVFLAAFMIAFRPTHVFESMGEREQSLFESAGPLISCFERIVDSLATNGSFYLVSFDLTVGFVPMLLSYLKCFKAWKVPDEAKLTCRIKHALLALYQAEEHLPPNEPEDSKLKIEFRTQIARLRSKLTQIAGSDALAEFADHVIAVPRLFREQGENHEPKLAAVEHAALAGTMTAAAASASYEAVPAERPTTAEVRVIM